MWSQMFVSAPLTHAHRPEHMELPGCRWVLKPVTVSVNKTLSQLSSSFFHPANNKRVLFCSYI